MLMMSTSTAMRGDSVRQQLLKDLHFSLGAEKEKPVDSIALPLPSLVARNEDGEEVDLLTHWQQRVLQAVEGRLEIRVAVTSEKGDVLHGTEKARDIGTLSLWKCEDAWQVCGAFWILLWCVESGVFGEWKGADDSAREEIVTRLSTGDFTYAETAKERTVFGYMGRGAKKGDKKVWKSTKAVYTLMFHNMSTELGLRITGHAGRRSYITQKAHLTLLDRTGHTVLFHPGASHHESRR